MARQSRRIYHTGDAGLDMALADIAKRLDTLEGLRPELTSGFAKLDGEGGVSTTESPTGLTHGDEVDNPSTGVHGVNGAVMGTSDSQVVTNKKFGTATQYATLSGTGQFSIYDENTELIHQMG